jgi:YggT family protein
MQELLAFIGTLVSTYKIILVAAVLMQLLLQFNAIPYSNPIVRSIYQGLYAVTEPALAPIRRRLPKSSSLDFSPLVLILILMFIEAVALPNIARAVA